MTESLLTGMLGLRPRMAVAETVLYLTYAVPMSLYVLWPRGAKSPKRSPSTAETAA